MNIQNAVMKDVVSVIRTSIYGLEYQSKRNTQPQVYVNANKDGWQERKKAPGREIAVFFGNALMLLRSFLQKHVMLGSTETKTGALS